MKGAILDWIRAKFFDRTYADNIVQYVHRYELADLQDDSLITKYLLLNNVNPTPPDPVVITAGTTVTPLTVAFAGGASTGYSLVRTTGDRAPMIDNDTNVGWDFATFTIYGADDGTGHFADSFIFGIKP